MSVKPLPHEMICAADGVVLDNTNLPVPGVTARIRGTALTAVADAEGHFTISGAPVGAVDLIIDGSTTTRPGAWPDLEYDLVTIPGRENTVGTPIYLLPLDLEHSLFVSETEGGTITLPNLPGFALEVPAGSVTFPGGGKSGLLSVTVVHSDKVPMTPNFGQQPRLIITIQPAGALFDPPARLTFPNVDCLAPGEVTEMYSFDHDLGKFVSIGPATTSNDATLITSNPGVGILKAGWHSDGQPTPTSTPGDCGQCQLPSPVGCIIDDTLSCSDGDSCTFDDRCVGGQCRGEPIKIGGIEATAAPSPAAIDWSVRFTANAPASTCPSLEFLWEFGDGAAGSGQSTSHAYAEPGSYFAEVTATCAVCPEKQGTAAVGVTIEDFTVGPEGSDSDLEVKPSADIEDLGVEIEETFDDIVEIWDALAEETPVITSGNDSTHPGSRAPGTDCSTVASCRATSDSKHYLDLAIDLRAKNVSDALAELLADRLQDRLGGCYDAFFEGPHEANPNLDHIHVEYEC